MRGKRPMDKYIAWILAHPMSMMGYLFCIAAVFIYFGFSVNMDNSMEVWFPSSDVAVDQYQRFLQDFGNDEFILIAAEHKAGFTYQELLLDQKLTQALEEVNGIASVFSLSNIFNQASLDFNAFRDGMLASSLFRRALISDDGRVTALIMQLSPEGLRNRQGVVDRVRELMVREVPISEKLFIAGPPIFNTELDRMSRSAAVYYFPLLFCVIVSILFFLFRSLVGVFLPTFIIILSLLFTLGWMGLWGGSINIVTVALFPLMMVLSLSYSIYSLSSYNNYMRAEPVTPSEDRKKEIIAHSCKEVRFPIFLCALTTAVGFDALIVSEVTPVNDFGFFSTLGISSAFLLIMFFLPPALLLFPAPSRPFEGNKANKRLHHLFLYLSFFVVNKRYHILVFCLILFFASLSGIARLQVETNALKFFPQNSQMVQTYTFIEDRLTGLSPIEIVIEPKNVQITNLLPPRSTLTEVRLVQDFLSRQKEIVTSKSIANILEDDIMQGVSRQPLRHHAPSVNDAAVEGYFNLQRQAVRVSAKARTLGSSEYRMLIEKITHYLNTCLRGDLRAYTTGIVPIIFEMQDKLLAYLIESFSITFVIIGLIFLFLTRSFKNMLISMIPNVLPIAMVLGFMGWAGIKLDVATIMIASIALGIAVDDTIHFLSVFKKMPSGQGGYDQRIHSTLSSVGEAMIFASVVNMCGFAVLCFSDFGPMINFGLLSSVTIFFALICELIIMPACLAAFNVRLR